MTNRRRLVWPTPSLGLATGIHYLQLYAKPYYLLSSKQSFTVLGLNPHLSVRLVLLAPLTPDQITPLYHHISWLMLHIGKPSQLIFSYFIFS